MSPDAPGTQARAGVEPCHGCPARGARTTESHESTISQPAAELARQVDALVEAGYPSLAAMDEAQFRALLEPLHVSLADAVASGLDLRLSALRVPFVVVVTDQLIAAGQRQALTRLAGGKKAGFVDKNHGEDGMTRYRPVDGMGVPEAGAYLLLDVERGEEFRGVAPKDALPVIADRRQTPLTIDEGIALVTLFPEVLERNRCFMLAGSRQNDKRVPAMGISECAPKLGWCWEGNPHDWLGVASAAGRAA